MAYHQHQYRSPFGDTTFTKVFVGGLAWETPTEKMREYFEQFGEILEAVIIADKNTGKSKGYGFVTFRDAESANRACEIANPMIDGRRANCNIASFGRSTPPPPRGGIRHGAPSSPPTPAGMHAIPPHPAANPFYYQSSYGYTPYAPGYGYHQAMYNAQQYQQGQYYPQVFGGASVSSSMAMSNQYGYGYPLGGSRATFHPPRMPPIYYSATASATRMEAPSCSPDASTAVASLQNATSVCVTQQPSFSISSDSQLQDRTSASSDAVVVTTGGNSI